MYSKNIQKIARKDELHQLVTVISTEITKGQTGKQQQQQQTNLENKKKDENNSTADIVI